MSRDDDDDHDDPLIPLGRALDMIRLGVITISDERRAAAAMTMRRSLDEQDRYVMRAAQRRAVQTFGWIEKKMKAARDRASERIAVLKEMDAPAEDIEDTVEILRVIDEDVQHLQTLAAEVEREP